MKWFRLYGEARNDAKLRALSDAQHRIWFNLLCYASEMETRGCINSVDRELLSVECAAGDVDLLNETLEKLIKLRIVTAEDENVCFVNFMKRQYDKPSDTPARVSERVSRHRTKPETPEAERVTLSNANVTPKKRAYSDTDTDSEKKDKDALLRNKAAAVPPPAGNTAPEKQLTSKERQEKYGQEACDAYQSRYKKRYDGYATLIPTMAAQLKNLRVNLPPEKFYRALDNFFACDNPLVVRRRHAVAMFFGEVNIWENCEAIAASYPPGGLSPRASPNPAHPGTFQGVIDDTARALRAEEARLEAVRQTSQRKGLSQ